MSCRGVLEQSELVHSAGVCCWPLLLSSDGALESLDRGLEGGVLLDTSLGDGGGVDDGRVVPAEEPADVWEGGVQEASAEVHGELAREGNVAAPSLGAQIGRA